MSIAAKPPQQTVLDFRPSTLRAAQQGSMTNSDESELSGTRQACMGCKRRKVKCDSAKPICGYCAQRNKECVYPSPYKRASCSQSRVEELEKRLLEFGQRLGIPDPLAESVPAEHQPRKQSKKRAPKSQQEQAPPPPSQHTSGTETVVIPELHPAPTDGMPDVHESVIPEGTDDSHQESSSDDFPVMDGMVPYARSPPHLGRGSFFGASSTFNFVMKMKTQASPTATHAHTSPETTHAHSKKRPREETEDDGEKARKYIYRNDFFALPQRHVAKFLLEKYFTAVHPVWPFLIEEDTRTHFDLTWTSDTPQDSMWLAILNLIFALGCQFCEDTQGDMSEVPIDEPVEAGKEFYHRARGFVLTNMFDSGSIEMVQALLLMAQYQQGTMRPNQCWLTVGHATRMSQGIGLHLDLSDLKISPIERELAKRLWWGCFCLDRVTSMIYGRPVAIPRDHLQECDFPLAVDDKHVAAGREQPSDKISTNAFFVANITLYLVMDDILARIYRGRASTKGAASTLQRKEQFPFIHHTSDNGSDSPLSYLTAVIQLEKELMDWHASLPAMLQFSLEHVRPDLRGSPELQRQRNILHARFLGIRILLHRQTMLYLVQDPTVKSNDPMKANPTGGPPMPKDNARLTQFEISMARVSAGICVKAAQLQIESVHLFRKMKLMGAWWWSYHFTFNALCVLAGALALDKEDRAVVIPDSTGLKSLIAKGFFDLQDMRKRAPMVERSESFLRELLKAAERTTDKKAEPAPPPQPTSAAVEMTIPGSMNGDIAAVIPDIPDFPFADSFDELSINPLFGEGSPSLIDILAAAGPQSSAEGLTVPVDGGDLQSFEDLLQNSFDVWNFFQSPETSSQPQMWR